MKFDYYGNNIDFDHQISRHKSDVSTTKSRETVKVKRAHDKTLTFFIILVEILFILLVTGYYISPLNRVAHVSVTGNRTVMRQSILSDMKARPKDSVTRLLFRKADYKKNAFTRNAQLRSVNVNLHDWNHVSIKVKEYPIIAYLNRDHHYYAVLNNGKRAFQNTKPNEVNPILYGFKSSTVLTAFTKSYHKIPDSIKPDIDRIFYSPTKYDPHRIRIEMNDGNRVYANFATWDKKMKYYPAISKSMRKSGIINLELGAYSAPFNKYNRSKH